MLRIIIADQLKTLACGPKPLDCFILLKSGATNRKRVLYDPALKLFEVNHISDRSTNLWTLDELCKSEIGTAICDGYFYYEEERAVEITNDFDRVYVLKQIFDVTDFHEFQSKSQKFFLIEQLEKQNFNVSKTAIALDIQRSHLYNLISQYKIEIYELRKSYAENVSIKKKSLLTECPSCKGNKKSLEVICNKCFSH